MIRVLIFLALIGALALGGAWLADRPGQVAVTWMGARLETSLLVAAMAVLAAAVAVMAVWSLIRLLLRSPAALSQALLQRRRRKGYLAISRGLVAIGAGDARAARRHAGEATRIAPGEPLALLLRAQTAQLAGDRTAAEDAFRAMTDNEETRVLGLRGLYVEAQRRNDRDAARKLAEEAAQTSPALPWAGQAVLDYRCADGDWPGALATIEASRRSKLIDTATYKRHRAVLLTARALDIETSDPPTAKANAVEAAKLAPELAPAAALAGRLLAEGGDRRKAARILEAAWRRSPHPDIAEVYANLRSGISARERLTRVQALARQSSGHEESAIAIARAAVDAAEYGVARKALARLIGQPTQRVAMLMAQIEEGEHGDDGRARGWTARAVRAARDPAWTAEGMTSDRWMPVSPVSGRLDAFEWKVPVAELARGPVVDDEPPASAAALAAPVPEAARAPEMPLPAAAAPVAPPLVAGTAAAAATTAEPAVAEPPPAEPAALPDKATASETPVVPAEAPRAAAAAPRMPAAEKVVPLVHAPDDPGPDAEPPVPEAADGERRRFPLSFR